MRRGSWPLVPPLRVQTRLCDKKKCTGKTSDRFGPWVRHIKYVSLPGSNRHVIDTVRFDMVYLGRQLQFHGTSMCYLWVLQYLGELAITPLANKVTQYIYGQWDLLYISILVSGYDTLLFKILLNIAAVSLLTTPKDTQRRLGTPRFQDSTRSPLANFILASYLDRYVRLEHHPKPTSIIWRVYLSYHFLKTSKKVTSYTLL